MEREIQHLSHEHPLFLKAKGYKTDDSTDQPDIPMACNGCPTPISGPFYSCEKCVYVLHKVCAELPYEMNHPMHPQHPLTLLTSTDPNCSVRCNMCRRVGEKFIYNCSICSFHADIICASASHTIKDKCHQHPLTPLQLHIPFPCHICGIEEKGLSYKCNICPFWVHQNCTVLLTTTVKYSYHKHLLTLLQSVPLEYFNVSRNCDICYGPLSAFPCVYYCLVCMFFAHVSCARSEITLSSSISRIQNIEINQGLGPDGQCITLLPLQPNSTDLISWFVLSTAAATQKFYPQMLLKPFLTLYNNMLNIIKNIITILHLNIFLDIVWAILSYKSFGWKRHFPIYFKQDVKIRNKINHFDHKHPLFLIDGNEKICQACAVLITTLSYGCNECDYFLHKCCTELPEQILHPSHPEHEVSLCNPEGSIFHCMCYQWCNGFRYKCLKCEGYSMDIKCASLIRPIYHKAHRHPLIPRLISSTASCSACRTVYVSKCFLQCDTCNFILCLMCAMAPPVIKHRWDKHPFKLTYSPPEHHYNEYYCALCEDVLNPKEWFYHCCLCDQFAHVICMLGHSADSNIKYGRSYYMEDHEHDLTLIDGTYNKSICDQCRSPLKRDLSIGFECKSCDFHIHLECTS